MIAETLVHHQGVRGVVVRDGCGDDLTARLQDVEHEEGNPVVRRAVECIEWMPMTSATSKSFFFHLHGLMRPFHHLVHRLVHFIHLALCLSCAIRVRRIACSCISG